VSAPVKICFDTLCVDPAFAGLAPGFVGLYQLNAVVPQGVPAGDRVPTWLRMAGVNSNFIYIALR
jgi:uncharacterized protein (TIGR03437 family)